jgi:AmmeMemoRadiSam system protein A
MLNDGQRRVLIALARESVAARVHGRGDVPVMASLEAEATGVFVTVKCHGKLRGCLGVLECARPLGEEVARCAADAASRDPRFAPIASHELDHLSVEVSVLGPLERIDPRVPHAITIGRHGLMIQQGRSRGVLLPQVAIEWCWTREQFLCQTCLKANLPADAWQRGAVVYRFDAEVFGDDAD